MGMKEDVLAHIDPYNKLPTFTREQWEPIMDRYDCGKDGENRDKWLSAIADYIIDNDIEFPKKKTIQTVMYWKNMMIIVDHIANMGWVY
jgi:hypothetical protein